MHGTIANYYLLRGHKAWVQYFDHVFEPDPCLLLDIKTHVNIQSYMCQAPDRTKTQNGLGNESKNGSIKLKIFTPSGHGKSFHGRSLTSALVIRTSLQVTPPVPRCMAS